MMVMVMIVMSKIVIGGEKKKISSRDTLICHKRKSSPSNTQTEWRGGMEITARKIIITRHLMTCIRKPKILYRKKKRERSYVKRDMEMSRSEKKKKLYYSS